MQPVPGWCGAKAAKGYTCLPPPEAHQARPIFNPLPSRVICSSALILARTQQPSPIEHRHLTFHTSSNKNIIQSPQPHFPTGRGNPEQPDVSHSPG